MNAETLNLISGVIEELLAAIPQIVVVLTTVVYSLNAIKAKVNTFPTKMEDTKLSLNKSFDETKESLNTSFSETKKEIIDIVDNTTKKISESVDEKLIFMAEQLKDYKKQLQSESDQVNLLVRQNKVFTELLGKSILENPEKISNEVLQIINQRVTLSKEDLESYPTLLIKELPMLQNALKEALVVLGEGKFKEILGKIGYGKDN
jgi:hypothetical protein